MTVRFVLTPACVQIFLLCLCLPSCVHMSLSIAIFLLILLLLILYFQSEENGSVRCSCIMRGCSKVMAIRNSKSLFPRARCPCVIFEGFWTITCPIPVMTRWQVVWCVFVCCLFFFLLSYWQERTSLKFSFFFFVFFSLSYILHIHVFLLCLGVDECSLLFLQRNNLSSSAYWRTSYLLFCICIFSSFVYLHTHYFLYHA